MIYLNYAATTPISKDNLNVFMDVSNEYFQYPAMNKNSNELQEQARVVVQNLLNYKTHNVIYTSGGTEANNLAIIGYAKKFETKKHFITTTYEHASVYESFKEIEKMGHSVSYVKPNEDGIITAQSIIDEITKDSVMVSVMQVNNELGSVNDINYIFGKVKAVNKNIITMCDAVQAVTKIEVPQSKVTDMLIFSSHKFYGPKACGILLLRKDLNLISLIHGGGNENNMRAGLQNLAAQVTMSRALKHELDNMDENKNKIDSIKNYVLSRIDEYPQIELNINPRVGIISINIDTKCIASSIVDILFENGIEVSTRSGCSTTKKTMSRSLTAIGMQEDKIMRTIRVSVSKHTTYEEIDRLFTVLSEKVFDK